MLYVNRFNFSVIAGAVLVAGALMHATTSHARDMDITDRSDGGIEIRFQNGCFIAYDQYGERGGHAGQCKNRQFERADEAAKAHQKSNSNTSADSVPEGQMQKYCMGEASAELNTRPTNISTQSVERRGNKYVVHGQSPQSGSNATTFECTFNQHGVFKGVGITSRANAVGHSSNDNGIPHAAKQKCKDMMGGPVKFGTISALRPGYWEVIMNDANGPRSVACTVTSSAEIKDWVELN
ncbi:MAG: hypothetical protein WBS20_15020 [Lysobacterales bacterium]